MILNCQHELVIPLDLAEVSLAIALDRAVKLWGPELDCWRTEGSLGAWSIAWPTRISATWEP